MARAESAALVAVKIFVKQNIIAPMLVGLKLFVVAVNGAPVCCNNLPIKPVQPV